MQNSITVFQVPKDDKTREQWILGKTAKPQNSKHLKQSNIVAFHDIQDGTGKIIQRVSKYDFKLKVFYTASAVRTFCNVMI